MDDIFDNPSAEERQEAQRQRSAETLRRQMRALTDEQIEKLIKEMVGDWLGVDLNTNEGRQRIRDRSAWFSNRFDKREEREDAERWLLERFKDREKIADLERWARGMKAAFGTTFKTTATAVLGVIATMVVTYLVQHR